MQTIVQTIDGGSWGSLMHYITSRGVKMHDTTEITNAHLKMINARERIVTSRTRKMNPGFAIAEWLMLMNGEDDIELLAIFIDNIRRFSDDDKTLAGAYGPKVIDQIQGVIDRLTFHKQSRQAVMTVYASEDLYDYKTSSVPCTISLQFIVRGDQLDCICTMRSNDVVWGLTYDMFNFTMLQEYIANQLNVKLGSYYHNAGSLHIYDRHYDMAHAVYKESFSHYCEMGPMPHGKKDIVTLMLALQEIANDNFIRALGIAFEIDNIYYLDMYYVMVAMATYRGSMPVAKESYSKITNYYWKRTLQPYLEYEGE